MYSIFSPSLVECNKAFHPDAKAAPIKPWTPNKLQETVDTINFFLIAFLYIKFWMIACIIPPVTPAIIEYIRFDTYKEEDPTTMAPAINPWIKSL